MQETVASPTTEQMRAGAKALSIFTYSLYAKVLRTHAEGRLRAGELEERIGWAAQSSLRSAVSTLCDLSILARVELDAGSLSTATELTEAGRELLPVADALERWLQHAPNGPVPLDDDAARGLIRVLAAGWDSTMVRTMAEKPLTLAEMSAGIADLSYPALKRRLAKLRSTRLAEPVESEGNVAAYAATDWLRHAIAPLAMAGRWERKHDPQAQPISRIEIEAAFLLTLPFVELPDDASGTCTLAVLTTGSASDQGPGVAGVAVGIAEGKVLSCVSQSARSPATWALGTADAWLDAVIDRRIDALRVSGLKPPLAEQIVTSLHETLFSA